MGGVYVLTSHCNFKTCVNVPHVNKTVTDFLGVYTDIPPVATPLDDASTTVVPRFILSSTTADITNLTSLQ